MKECKSTFQKRNWLEVFRKAPGQTPWHNASKAKVDFRFQANETSLATALANASTSIEWKSPIKGEHKRGNFEARSRWTKIPAAFRFSILLQTRKTLNLHMFPDCWGRKRLQLKLLMLSRLLGEKKLLNQFSSTEQCRGKHLHTTDKMVNVVVLIHPPQHRAAFIHQ